MRPLQPRVEAVRPMFFSKMFVKRQGPTVGDPYLRGTGSK